VGANEPYYLCLMMPSTHCPIRPGGSRCRSLALLAVALAFPLQASAQGVVSSTLEGLPIRRIVVEGLTRMDEDVVRRRLELRVGEPWRAKTARRDEQAVTGLMIFWSVRIVPRPLPDASAPNAVEAAVILEERFGWFLLPQMQYEEESGWSFGGAGGHFNLFRRGHWFYVTLLGGGSRYLSASFRNTWNGPHHESFRFGGAAVSLHNRLYDFRETGERLNLQFGRWVGRTGRLAGGAAWRRIEGEVPDWVPATAGTRFDRRQHLMWASVGFDTTDPWAWPRPGRTTSLHLEAYGGLLGGDVRGYMLTATHVLRAHLLPRLLAAGYALVQIQDGDRPFWRLLPLGGMNSLRGYEFGNWLVERRWETSLQLEWQLAPVRTLDLGALGDQIVGLAAVIFGEMGAGTGVRRGPGSPPWSRRSPTLVCFGGGLTFYSALLGTLRLEIGWPGDGGPPVMGLGLEPKF